MDVHGMIRWRRKCHTPQQNVLPLVVAASLAVNMRVIMSGIIICQHMLAFMLPM